MSRCGKCIYLFLQSVVPTVPAGWLTFAEGVVYKHYNQPVRVWGISATDDQQIAGAIMKIGGSMFLWALVSSTSSSGSRRIRKRRTRTVVSH